MDRKHLFLPRFRTIPMLSLDEEMCVADAYVPQGRAFMNLTIQKPAGRVNVQPGAVRLPQTGIRERRRKPRITLQPMYTRVLVRALNEKSDPVEGHVVDLSEVGLAVELDRLL